MRRGGGGFVLRPGLGDFIMLWVLLVTVVGVGVLSLFVIETPAVKVIWLLYAGCGVVLIRDRLRRMLVRSQVRVPSSRVESR
jgi:hypothetical protein